MTVAHTQTQADPASTSGPGTERVLLQRQILPKDRDTDVIKLYVDPDPAALDADKYDIGHTRAAQEANAIATRIQNAARGVSAIHPDQIAPCNTVFSPSADEIVWAQAVVAAFDLPENAGKGAIKVDGKMVELLHLDQARRVLAVAQAVASA